MKLRTTISTSLLALLLPLLTAAETLTGRVVKITDGDTVHVLDNVKERHKIRLQGIDAPERGQPFGKRAKEHLSSLVAGADVKVDWHKRDRYKRIIGKVIHVGSDVNLAMVNAGYAWWYRKYAHEQSPVDQVLYEAAENNARATRAGLWLDPNPVPPWKWRRR